jgi:hypothetical protein
LQLAKTAEEDERLHLAIPTLYTIRDATDRVLVRVYGQDEPIEGGVPAITLDEAIAMLPQTLSESEKLHLRLEGQPL